MRTRRSSTSSAATGPESNTNIGRDAGAAGGQASFTVPTNFYKAEDSNVFSRISSRRSLRPIRTRYTDIATGSLGCNNTPFGLVCAGDNSREAYYNTGTFYNNYRYYWAKDPQKQANVTGVEVLQHRHR